LTKHAVEFSKNGHTPPPRHPARKAGVAETIE
jgi:hypothetical protein